MAVFCFVLEHHLDGKAAAKEVGVRPIHVCLWATKKIFLPFLRMNSNPHRNSNYPQSGYLYFFTIHYYLLLAKKRQEVLVKSEE